MAHPPLLLLPNLLGELRDHHPFLPISVDQAVETLDGLIAESDREGRRYLGRFQTKKRPQDIPIAQLNEHTPKDHYDFLLEPILKGERWGLVSDSGLPCIADPGAKLVERARKLNIPIQAFTGPSSIMLSLMLSGLPGQRFCFQGYLEKHPEDRQKQIIQLERASQKEKMTQIFIEAPYRNQHLLEALCQFLHEETRLCVAWNLTMPDQGVISKPIRQWRKVPLPDIQKKPAIFLFCVPQGEK